MTRRVLVVAAIAIVLAAAVVAFWRPPGREVVDLVVARGTTTRAVASALRERGVIRSELWFRVMARLRGVDGRIQAGRYELRRGMGTMGAIDVLGRPPDEVGVALTVPEGFSLRQIAERVGARTKIAADAFRTKATDGSIRADLQPPSVKTLEGLLYPETYLVSENETAEHLVKRMVMVFEQETTSVDWSYARSKGLTPYQAVILASLVEREAKVPEDRPKVAAVIYNRLARHMRLQIDITALYGLEEHKVPSRADLRRPSPYNTYLIDGLPPTPIASPGLDAIDAAVHPAKTDALYYVVCEPSGRHCFTNSFAEFERLKARRPAEVRG